MLFRLLMRACHMHQMHRSLSAWGAPFSACPKSPCASKSERGAGAGWCFSQYWGLGGAQWIQCFASATQTCPREAGVRMHADPHPDAAAQTKCVAGARDTTLRMAAHLPAPSPTHCRLFERGAKAAPEDFDLGLLSAQVWRAAAWPLE